MKILKTKRSREQFAWITGFSLWFGFMIWMISYGSIAAAFIAAGSVFVLAYVVWYVIRPAVRWISNNISAWINNGEDEK